MADFVLIAFVFLQFIPRHSSVPTTTTAGRVVTTSSRTSWNSFSLLHLSPAGQPMCSINSPARTISLNRTSYQIAPTSKCVPGNLLCGWECNRQPGCVGYNFKGSYTGKEICDLYTTKQMNFLPLANCSYYQVSAQNTFYLKYLHADKMLSDHPKIVQLGNISRKLYFRSKRSILMLIFSKVFIES